MRDEGRPFGISLQGRVPNHSELLRLEVAGGEHLRISAEANLRQVKISKTNKRELLLTHRKPENCCQNQEGVQLLGRICRKLGYGTDGNRCKGGVRLIWALVRNCGNQSLRCKGRSTNGRNHKARVPMRRTETDQLVTGGDYECDKDSGIR